MHTSTGTALGILFCSTCFMCSVADDHLMSANASTNSTSSTTTTNTTTREIITTTTTNTTITTNVSTTHYTTFTSLNGTTTAVITTTTTNTTLGTIHTNASTSTTNTTLGSTTSVLLSTTPINYTFPPTTTEFQTTVFLTTTVTTATTTGRECVAPYDQFGTYNVVNGTSGDNLRWTLSCPPGPNGEPYISDTGLYEAMCLGNGVVWHVARCVPQDCAAQNQAMADLVQRYGQTWTTARTPTCADLLHQGDTCTIDCKKAPQGSDQEDELVMGYWTCLRGFMRGSPTCADTEAKQWLVSWVLPKIVGGFHFKGELLRSVNITNETMPEFGANITNVLVSMMQEIVLQDFNVMDFQIEDTEYIPIQHDFETSPTIWYLSTFSLSYEILIWDAEVLEYNLNVLSELIIENSTVEHLFQLRCFEMINFRYRMGSMMPLMVPLAYNETFVAPDSDTDTSARHFLSLTIFIAIVVSVLSL